MDIQTHQYTHYNYSASAENKQDGVGKISSENTHSPQLTESEAGKEQIIRELSARDREVRAHEQAHKAAAGSLAKGGPTYTYQRGPDGQLYAVGGEVKIDTAPVAGDPEATIQKAEQIKRAALAPAEPSAQDRAVAAQATQMAMQARAELQAEKYNANSDSISSELKTETTCPICGGKHSADTHIVVEANPA